MKQWIILVGNDDDDFSKYGNQFYENKLTGQLILGASPSELNNIIHEIIGPKGDQLIISTAINKIKNSKISGMLHSNILLLILY